MWVGVYRYIHGEECEEQSGTSRHICKNVLCRGRTSSFFVGLSMRVANDPEKGSSTEIP